MFKFKDKGVDFTECEHWFELPKTRQAACWSV